MEDTHEQIEPRDSPTEPTSGPIEDPSILLLDCITQAQVVDDTEPKEALIQRVYEICKSAVHNKLLFYHERYEIEQLRRQIWTPFHLDHENDLPRTITRERIEVFKALELEAILQILTQVFPCTRLGDGLNKPGERRGVTKSLERWINLGCQIELAKRQTDLGILRFGIDLCWEMEDWRRKDLLEKLDIMLKRDGLDYEAKLEEAIEENYVSGIDSAMV